MTNDIESSEDTIIAVSRVKKVIQLSTPTQAPI